MMMDKQNFIRLIPEIALLTTCEELIKQYADYRPGDAEARTERLYEDLNILHNGGKTRAQKCLAQGLAAALEAYFKAQ